MGFKRFIIFITLIIAGSAVQAQEQTITGYLDESIAVETYKFDFKEGETILLLTESTSNLDTVITLTDENDKLLAENDDYNASNFASALAYTIPLSGTYIVTVEQYENSAGAGEFTLKITIGDHSLFDYLDSISRVQLSGSPLIRDTEHFRIHYTLEGVDDTSLEYVEMVAEALEQVWEIQIEQMGWPAPPGDTAKGADDRYDVYITSLKQNGDITMGFVQGEETVGDNPYTPGIERYASTSFMALENDFSETMDEEDEQITLLRATIAHEFHHSIQFGYDYNESHGWYAEATSSWMETVTFDDAQDAVGYVSYSYTYPELCFGITDDPTDGMIQYGTWPFIQSLVDAHGTESIHRLWENVGEYEGFQILAETLAEYDESIPEAITRYHVQNLVRDYRLAPEFESTVWLEEIIRNDGEWTHTGSGIQELGANYFQLKQKPGVYEIKLSEKENVLELWAVGITADQSAAIPLGSSGLIDTTGYDFVYLMVFNPVYDDDLDDCNYYTYDLQVQAASDAVNNAPVFTFDASHFEMLTMSEN